MVADRPIEPADNAAFEGTSFPLQSASWMFITIIFWFPAQHPNHHARSTPEPVVAISGTPRQELFSRAWTPSLDAVLKNKAGLAKFVCIHYLRCVYIYLHTLIVVYVMYIYTHTQDLPKHCPTVVCPSSIGLHHLQPTGAQERHTS